MIAHAIAKSALFLTAGTVTEATGEDRLSRLGGLRRPMPLLAVSSGLAAATLTSLPLTLGFFADEFFFAAALERGPLFVGFAVVAAATTLTYTWRFWSGIFLGERRREPRSVLPGARRAGSCARGSRAGGRLRYRPFPGPGRGRGAGLFRRRDAAGRFLPPRVAPRVPDGARGLRPGVGLILSRPVWSPAALGVSRLGEIVGPERLYRVAVRGLNLLSDAVHRLEIRNLRGRISFVLLPMAVLVGAGVLAAPMGGAYRVGGFRADDAPLVLAMLAVAVAAVTTTLVRRHVTLALVLSGSGFVLAVVYAFHGAPNVVLVAVLVETMLTLLLVATLRLIPYRVLHRQARVALGQAGAQDLRLRGRGRLRVRGGLGGALAAARGDERRRRARKAHPGRPRQERRHGHAGRLPRPRHSGRDHGRLPRPARGGHPLIGTSPAAEEATGGASPRPAA